MLYLVLLYRCVRIVTQSPKAFGALLAAGLSFSLTIQAFANMAVAVGSIFNAIDENKGDIFKAIDSAKVELEKAQDSLKEAKKDSIK